VVYAKPPFSGPEAVLAYLSRYTHRVAISNQRLIGFDETGVTFRYKDCRHRVPEPDRVWGVQRRALVLAANELVMNALFHAFQGRRRGQLVVKLRSYDSRHACLAVFDYGIGYDGDRSAPECGVAGGLADLLASTIVYRRGDRGGTIAQIHFPLNVFRRANFGRR
jgi:hypothetical protein